MKWKEARMIAERCHDCFAYTVDDKHPKPNSLAGILCKRKVLRGEPNDDCPGIERCDEGNGRMKGWERYYGER